jgi:hypothetical protein
MAGHAVAGRLRGFACGRGSRMCRMKKAQTTRDDLSLHEAGHLLAIALVPDFEAGDFVWRRLQHYEIAHVEPVSSRTFTWETSADRNMLIARRAAIALAGGAAAEAWYRPGSSSSTLTARVIHERVGKVDFELAHEWLTLQRYDPDQESLELEIHRLFRELVQLLEQPIHRSALDTISRRILDQLQMADARGLNLLRVPACDLLEGLELSPCHDFVLRETLSHAQPSRTRTGTLTS